MSTASPSSARIEVIEFYAPWCVQCEQMRPEVEALLKAFSLESAWRRINVETEPAAAARFAVTSIPALVVLRDGAEQGRLVGLHPPQFVVELLRRLA